MTGSRDRRAFTLIELMLALALAGVVLATAVALMRELGDVSVVLARADRASDAPANGSRMLRHLVSDLISTADSTRRFVGDERSAAFDTWCTVPAGWTEPCRVMLALDVTGDSTAVRALLQNGHGLTLAVIRGRAALRFMSARREENVWLSSWGTSTLPPAAIAIVTPVDTIVLPVGDRG